MGNLVPAIACSAPKVSSNVITDLPIGSKAVPFCGLYLGSYKVTPKRELLWSLWVPLSEGGFDGSELRLCLPLTQTAC